MKTAIRILCLCMVLCMTVGFFGVIGFAADETFIYSATGTWIGIPSDAEDVVYLSDGAKDDKAPKLVTGYYVSSTEGTWESRNQPKWNTSYGTTTYLRSVGGLWGLTKGKTDQSGYGTDEKGEYRLKDGVKYYHADMYLGNVPGVGSTRVEHGIGVTVSPADQTQNYVMFDVDGYGRFYAVVGLTGTAFNNQASNVPTEFGGTGSKGIDENTGANTVVFEVWGSKKEIKDSKSKSKANDSSFELLAESIEIGGQKTGEFSVDISGYKTLKLVTKAGTATGSTSGLHSLWGNACIYNGSAINASPETPTEPAPELIGTYTPSEIGFYNAVPIEFAASIKYLTTMPILDSSNTVSNDAPNGKPSSLDYPYGDSKGTITIGALDTNFFYGIGMHPKNPKQPLNGSIESWTIIDVSAAECDRFYSVVGITNAKGKGGAGDGVVFRVYGDYEGNGNYTLLAQSDVVKMTASGEFDVDITGVKTLKLAVVCGGSNHASSACAWANACVYSTVVPETEPPTEPETQKPTTAPTTAPTKAPATTEPTDDTTEEPSSPVGLIIGIVAAVLVIAGVVVFIIIKKKKSA